MSGKIEKQGGKRKKYEEKKKSDFLMYN